MTTTDVQTVRVDLGPRSYDILIGTGILANAGEILSPILAQKRAIIITDDNVADLHLATLTRALDGAAIDHSEIVLPHGEGTKDFSHLQGLVEKLLDLKVERQTTLIALGGGVIGDITGFAANVTLRGINFVQAPTTLLAQVDSSVGGKTGINTTHGKNLVGSFYQPRLVLADIATLETLPRRELLAGYGETVKYGLINDPAFFGWLEENGAALCAGDGSLRIKAVETSCRAKATIVAEDERESGQRALLNLGHTFGHALEAETGYCDRLLHGESVAIGMVLAFDLSVRLGLCPAEDAERLRNHFKQMGLPTSPADIAGEKLAPEALLAHMAQDKKVRDGAITFVMARGIGQAFLTEDIRNDDLLALLRDHLTA
ncbi:MAG: 3-dehydroquinate synthase [Rhodospirillaceae bacterium]|jgi:3-dehydroquinate synthase|nr:3-dehydroquinate synthase [Rhodospirillaceae bacterium]MBT5751116.1 3-dehydroquinate synthase [Rhodospirillaceae bacterium]